MATYYSVDVSHRTPFFLDSDNLIINIHQSGMPLKPVTAEESNADRRTMVQ